MSDSYLRRLGNLLRVIRIQLNKKHPREYSLRGMEKKTSLNASTISRIENGKHDIFTHNLMDLCEGLEVPLCAIMAIAAAGEGKFPKIEKRMKAVAISQLKKLGFDIS